MTAPTTNTDFDLGQHNVWVRVDHGALRRNAEAVRSFLKSGDGGSPDLMAVVKANGYGHGVGNAAQAFRDGGAGWFGVTSIVEADELIASGIDPAETPILVFSPLVTERQCDDALRGGVHLTVCDPGHIDLVDRAANRLGVVANVHLKVDTGMGRLGLPPAGALKTASEILRRPSLKLTAVYTHFARATENDLTPTRTQLKKFTEFCDSLAASGAAPFLRHCANSAALARLPESRLDLVRAGTLLYGQYPSSDVPKLPGLNASTLFLEARATFVHDLPAGVSVGYGAEYKTTRPTRAAVIPVGFADGVAMQPSSVTQGVRGLKQLVAGLVNPQVLFVKFGGFAAPVIGRVAMQMIVVDVTDAPTAVAAGDIAAVPARRLAISASLPRIVVNKEIAP